MLKEEEIAAIEKLTAKSEDTYFGEVFTAEDGFIMTQNIANDFCILQGTRLGNELDDARSVFSALQDREKENCDLRQEIDTLEGQMRETKDQIESLVVTFIKNDRCYQDIIDSGLITREEVIKIKVKYKFDDFDQEERNLMIKMLNGGVK